MEKITDWCRLWKELSDIQEKAFVRKKEHQSEDFWKHKAKKYDTMVDERWAKPDSSRDFLIEKLRANPGARVLDIGAGTGKWSLLLAPHASRVTALDPSLAMQEVLREKIQNQGISNIDIITGSWPGSETACHDYVLASHSMYGVANFKAFVNQMIQTAGKACILLLRAPLADSVMAEAARHVLGQPYDSPNFQIAYNILLGMDIYPQVIMEADGAWPDWTNDSLGEALDEIKNRLDLTHNSHYDDFLRKLLEKNLRVRDGKVVWPKGTRSALVYWEV